MNTYPKAAEDVSIFLPSGICARFLNSAKMQNIPEIPRLMTFQALKLTHSILRRPLKHMAKLKTGDFVFPGHGRGKPLSNMAMEMVLRRMKIENATVHGFRSSFRDWAGNVTNFPREVTETALSHVIGDKAEQAYRRSDALDKRRKLMEAWAAHCEPRASANVVHMRKRKWIEDAYS
jgi:hypothetical protein